MKTTTSIILALILFASCSVEKRHYIHGYTVSWNKNIDTKSTRTVKKVDFLSLNANAPNEAITNPDSCDIVFLSNGKTINVRILEFNSNTVKYFDCNDKDETVKESYSVAIDKIVLSSGVSIDQDSLNRINTKIKTNTVRENDVVYFMDHTITGKVTKMSQFDITFLKAGDPEGKETKILKKYIHKIYFGNCETIRRPELKEIKSDINSREEILKYTQTKKVKVKTTPTIDSCDQICLKNGKIIYSHILEFNPMNVKYLKANDKSETVRLIKKQQISKLVLRTGEYVGIDSLSKMKKKIKTTIKAENDIVFTRHGKLIGKVTELGSTSNGGYSLPNSNNKGIKFIKAGDPESKEITISAKSIKRIFLGNGEQISRTELKKISDKITTRAAVLNYTETEDFKIKKIKLLTKRALVSACFFFLPIVGIAFDVTALRQAHLAKTYIKENPELKKYSGRYELAQVMACLGVLLSIIAAFLGFLMLLLLGSSLGAIA